VSRVNEPSDESVGWEKSSLDEIRIVSQPRGVAWDSLPKYFYRDDSLAEGTVIYMVDSGANPNLPVSTMSIVVYNYQYV
jgi:hypothetical protein